MKNTKEIIKVAIEKGFKILETNPDGKGSYIFLMDKKVRKKEVIINVRQKKFLVYEYGNINPIATDFHEHYICEPWYKEIMEIIYDKDHVDKLIEKYKENKVLLNSFKEIEG